MDESERVLFDAFLRDFMIQVSFICSLESTGKIKPDEAFKKIKGLWKNLKSTKKQCHIKSEKDSIPKDGIVHE